MNMFRNCPKCKCELHYSNASKLKRANEQNTNCKNCSQKGTSKGKGRKQSEDHIRKRSLAVSEYRLGKTYEQLYGKEEGDKLAKAHSEKLKGKKRCEFSQEWKDNMSSSRKNSKVYKDWMNSDDYKNKRRSINAMRYYGISLEEWISLTDDKHKYYLEVRSITKSQNIQTLENYDKRGTSKNYGYHLDHIYPISLGYVNRVPPHIIGNIENLRFIPWKENILKSNQITNVIKENIELLISKKNNMIL